MRVIENLVIGLILGLILTLVVGLLIEVYARIGLSKEYPILHRQIQQTQAARLLVYTWIVIGILFAVAWIANPNWTSVANPFGWNDVENACIKLIGWSIPTLWFNLRFGSMSARTKPTQPHA